VTIIFRRTWLVYRREFVVCVRLIVLTMGAFFFGGGCGVSQPSIQAWQPWSEVYQSAVRPNVNSKLFVSIRGSNPDLLGEDSLEEVEIGKALRSLLSRRGYNIVTSGQSHFVDLQYKTERRDRLSASSVTSSSSYSVSTAEAKSGSLAATSLGVSIAKAVSRLSTGSSTEVRNQLETVPNYKHDFTIYIADSTHKIVWQGKSTWDSDYPNMAMDELLRGLQVVLSNLPKDQTKIFRVPEVKPESKDAYFRLYCLQWFACPALPYRIAFKNAFGELNDHSPTGVVKDPIAYEAFRDLIRTAEFALPTGKSDYSDPLSKALWSEVQLCEKYFLGKSNSASNIMIQMKAETKGYYLSKCWIASDAEYAMYQKKLDNWRTALAKFYDVYKN